MSRLTYYCCYELALKSVICYCDTLKITSEVSMNWCNTSFSKHTYSIRDDDNDDDDDDYCKQDNDDDKDH